MKLGRCTSSGRRRQPRIRAAARSSWASAPTTVPRSYFGDEEPEDGSDPGAVDEEEPDLEALLESQHYAFESEDGETSVEDAERLSPERARGLLDEERRQLLAAKAGVDDEMFAEDEAETLGELTDADQHPADTATETYEREKDLSLRDQIEARLTENAMAGKRVDEGTYGFCERCGEPISRARLEARPSTRWCATHRAEVASELG